MALREILTHHGGSAGVFMPDLSLDGALDELGDIDYSNSIKREREIDLNLQVSADEAEPQLKRQKFEDESSLSMDVTVSTGSGANTDFDIKVEGDGWNLPEGPINGQVDAIVVESKGYHEDNMGSVNSDILNRVPENSELMNLVKLARHSSIKNSEFLQDCTIRFLCILSLDRYGFVLDFNLSLDPQVLLSSFTAPALSPHYLIGNKIICFELIACATFFCVPSSDAHRFNIFELIYAHGQIYTPSFYFTLVLQIWRLCI